MTKTRDLADLGGGFIQAGTGALQRTVESKLQDTVSVLDFIPESEHAAIKNGTSNYDATAAIQAAINSVSGGGQVYFPTGTYKISSTLNVSFNGVVLKGAGRWQSRIRQHTLNTGIVSFSGIFCGLQTLALDYAGTPTVNATAVDITGSYATLTDFVVASSHIGVAFSGCVAGKVFDFEILDYESSGIVINDCNDIFVARFILNAGNSARGALGGIRLINKAEAIVVSDGDVLLGQYSMTMDAAVYGVATRPAYNNFTNVFFDSATLTSQINKCVETEFVGCWFSNGRSGGGWPGALLSNCDSVRFTNCRFFNSGSQGCLVASTAQNIIFTACKFESNSVTTGSGVAHGLQFSDNTTKFQVIGCRAANGLYTGQQGYGIFVGSGCSDYSLIGNNVLGNVQSPGLLDGGSQPKTVYGNTGFKTVNAGLATINSGATTVVITHGLNVTPDLKDITLTRTSGNAGSVDLYVTGITSTQFTINTAPAPGSDITLAWQARSRDA